MGNGGGSDMGQDGDTVPAERSSRAAAAPSATQGNWSVPACCSCHQDRQWPLPHVTHSLPSVPRPPPHQVAVLCKAALWSSIVFCVNPWGTVVGCPSPVLLLPREVRRARGVSGVPGTRLQWQIAAGEDGDMLGKATQLPPSPSPSPPHRVPALSKMVLRSLVVFPVVPGGWRGTVLGCPAPVLVEVGRTTEGSGLPGMGLRHKAPPVRPAARRGVLVLLQFPFPDAAPSSFCFSCSLGSPWVGPPRLVGEPRELRSPVCSSQPVFPYRMPPAVASPVWGLPGRLVPDVLGAGTMGPWGPGSPRTRLGRGHREHRIGPSLSPLHWLDAEPGAHPSTLLSHQGPRPFPVLPHATGLLLLALWHPNP